MTGHLSRTRRAATALLLAVTVVLAGGAWLPAEAHASLVSSSPKDGSVVQTAPKQVALTFDENIRTPSAIVVTGPDGKRADQGMTRVVDNRVSVDVATRATGRYTVAYRVVSADGHPVSDTLHFGYRSNAVSASSGPASKQAGGADSSPAWWVPVGAVVVVIGVVGLLVVRRRTPAASTRED